MSCNQRLAVPLLQAQLTCRWVLSRCAYREIAHPTPCAPRYAQGAIAQPSLTRSVRALAETSVVLRCCLAALVVSLTPVTDTQGPTAKDLGTHFLALGKRLVASHREPCRLADGHNGTISSFWLSLHGPHSRWLLTAHPMTKR